MSNMLWLAGGFVAGYMVAKRMTPAQGLAAGEGAVRGLIGGATGASGATGQTGGATANPANASYYPANAVWPFRAMTPREIYVYAELAKRQSYTRPSGAVGWQAYGKGRPAPPSYPQPQVPQGGDMLGGDDEARQAAIHILGVADYSPRRLQQLFAIVRGPGSGFPGQLECHSWNTVDEAIPLPRPRTRLEKLQMVISALRVTGTSITLNSNGDIRVGVVWLGRRVGETDAQARARTETELNHAATNVVNILDQWCLHREVDLINRQNLAKQAPPGLPRPRPVAPAGAVGWQAYGKGQPMGSDVWPDDLSITGPYLLDPNAEDLALWVATVFGSCDAWLSRDTAWKRSSLTDVWAHPVVPRSLLGATRATESYKRASAYINARFQLIQAGRDTMSSLVSTLDAACANHQRITLAPQPNRGVPQANVSMFRPANSVSRHVPAQHLPAR